eukprot:CAMPEP_0115888238 /NCGR_PEP_ID=MMETSP0287-20121206/32202_1 /TAXON_ID=412157 /ORGANISM="Chrysochromulina rotalis, Strain UIO044" /LENGTH=84 /DNA_ID=CAMNT_0003344911 /DNA_START=375 /DNA_END=629 /DNA_ORIENTATION=+
MAPIIRQMAVPISTVRASHGVECCRWLDDEAALASFTRSDQRGREPIEAVALPPCIVRVANPLKAAHEDAGGGDVVGIGRVARS